MRIASFVIGLLGAIGGLALGGKWWSDWSSPEGAAALKLAEALGKEGGGDALGLGNVLGLRKATYALLACGVLGLAFSVVVLIRKGNRMINGAILVIAGALPLVFAKNAVGGVLMVLAGIFAFFAKPKAAVA